MRETSPGDLMPAPSSAALAPTVVPGLAHGSSRGISSQAMVGSQDFFGSQSELDMAEYDAMMANVHTLQHQPTASTSLSFFVGPADTSHVGASSSSNGSSSSNSKRRAPSSDHSANHDPSSALSQPDLFVEREPKNQKHRRVDLNTTSSNTSGSHGDQDEVSTLPDDGEMHVEQQPPPQQPEAFLGFFSAGGRSVRVSEASLARARATMQRIEDAVEGDVEQRAGGPSAANAAATTPQRPRTGFGSPSFGSPGAGTAGRASFGFPSPGGAPARPLAGRPPVAEEEADEDPDNGDDLTANVYNPYFPGVGTTPTRRPPGAAAPSPLGGGFARRPLAGAGARPFRPPTRIAPS